MEGMVTVAFRVDDVIVRRTSTAKTAFALADRLIDEVHFHWLLLRHRETGESWTIRR